MTAASDRGTSLLLAHCAALARLEAEPERPPASQRLEEALGPELAQLLVGALTKGGRSRRLAA